MKSIISPFRFRGVFSCILLLGLLPSGLYTGNVPDARAEASAMPRPTTYSNEMTQSPGLEVALEMLGQVDKTRVLADLQRLTGEIPICSESGCQTISNRLTGSQGLGWAKDYVRKELSKVGYSVEVFDWSNSGYTDQNLIARKLGASMPNEEIYFVAHMDGTGTSESRNPAADDNASGVVDLLELARALSSYSFDRTVVLFFSTGEEQGTLGVRSYLSQLAAAELSSIKYVINVDMVGYDANHDWAMELWHGGHLPSLALAQWMKDTIKGQRFKLVPELVVGCG